MGVWNVSIAMVLMFCLAITTASAAAAGSEKEQAAVIKIALHNFYKKHAPDKVSKIAGAMLQFSGRELELVTKVLVVRCFVLRASPLSVL